MRKFFIIFIFIIGIVVVANAQETLTFSLKEAQEYAVKNNYKNQNSIKDIEIAKKKVWETTAIGLPQVNAQGQIQRFIDIPTTVSLANSFNPNAPEGDLTTFKFGLNYNNSVGITATQILFDGSYIVGLQAAKTFKNLSVSSQIKTEIELKDAVAQAYFTVLATIENIKVLEQSLASSKQLLAESNALFKEGFAEEQNVDQLSLNVNELITAEGIAKGQLKFAKKLLKLQLGISIDKEIELTDQLDSFVNEAITTDVAKKEFKADNHIDFQLATTNMKLTHLSLRREKYAFMPSLSAFFSHQQQNYSNSFDVFSGGRWFPATIVGATLTLPILSSGSRLSKVAQAKIELEKLEITSKEIEQNLIYQSELAISNLETSTETYQNKKENVVLAKKIYNKTIIKFSEGMATSIELTQAQNQYLNAQGSFVKAELDLLNAKSNVEKSYGQQ